MKEVNIKFTDALKQILLLPVLLILLLWGFIDFLELELNEVVSIVIVLFGILVLFYRDILSVVKTRSYISFAIFLDNKIIIYPQVGLLRKKIILNLDDVVNYKVTDRLDGCKQHVLELKNGEIKEFSINKYLGLAYSKTVEREFELFMKNILDVKIKGKESRVKCKA